MSILPRSPKSKKKKSRSRKGKSKSSTKSKSSGKRRRCVQEFAALTPAQKKIVHVIIDKKIDARKLKRAVDKCVAPKKRKGGLNKWQKFVRAESKKAEFANLHNKYRLKEIAKKLEIHE